MTFEEVEKIVRRTQDLAAWYAMVFASHPVLLRQVQGWDDDRPSFIIKEHKTWEEVVAYMRELSRDEGIRFKLENYWNFYGSLAIRYSTTIKGKSADINFYCTEGERALKKISKGKCKMVERVATIHEVTCELKGGES